MTITFVDTLYWIALTNPKDQWHQKAIEFKKSYLSVQLVTTELILIEYLNYYSSYGSQLRQISSQVVRTIVSDPAIEILPQTQDLFFSGLTLYEQRLDKGYSMVDCISMIVMKNRNLTEVLTHDKHFAQEGFKILL